MRTAACHGGDQLHLTQSCWKRFDQTVRANYDVKWSLVPGSVQRLGHDVASKRGESVACGGGWWRLS
jgi:hypothetical protein